MNLYALGKLLQVLFSGQKQGSKYLVLEILYDSYTGNVFHK